MKSRPARSLAAWLVSSPRFSFQHVQSHCRTAKADPGHGVGLQRYGDDVMMSFSAEIGHAGNV